MPRRFGVVALGLIAAALAAPALAAGSAAQKLADKYAPVLTFRQQPEPCGSGEPYRPISVGAVLGNPDVTLHGPSGVVKTGPTAADLYGKGDGYYLDFPGNPLEPGCGYEKLGRRWAGNRLPVVYAHIAAEEGRPGELALQYWIYYVFNDWNNLHESDWEMIQLVFHAADAAAALETHPYGVALSQHEGGERAAWSDTKLQKDGTHPIVYPGAGSHANYYSSAVWLGRSAKEGFGCDDTSPPSIQIRPAPVLVPTRVKSASDKYAWLGFTGRWGQKEASFNNGPTGPNAKEQWLRPIHWQENSQRNSSVQIPALHAMGPSVTNFFCGAVAAGSKALTLAQRRPFLFAAVMAAFVALVAFILTRTRWSPVETDPIEETRAIGQILRAAARLYRRHRATFLGIGAIFFPIGIVLTGIEAILFEDALAWTGLTGRRSGGGDTIGISVGGIGSLLGAAIVVGATSVALSRIAEGQVPRVRDVYRLVWARFLPLFSAILRAAIMIIVLALTLLGAPIALERSVRWSLAPQACLLGGPADGPLRSSARLTRRNWWRTFLLTSLMNLPAVSIALLVGTLFLLLVPAAPIYFVEMTTSIVFAFAYPYVGIATTLLYFDLLASREVDEPSLQPAPVS